MCFLNQIMIYLKSIRKYRLSRSTICSPTFFLTVLLLINTFWRVNLVFNYPLFDMADEMFHFDYAYKISTTHGLVDIFEDSVSTEVFDLAKNSGHWKKENIITPESIGMITPEIVASIHEWGWYAFDITGGSSYEGVQPPLYHIICALFIQLSDSMIMKAYIARLISLAFSIFTLIVTYRFLKKVTNSLLISLGTPVMLTVVPSWGFQTFRISNDIAAQFIVMLGLLLFYIFQDKRKECQKSSLLILGFVLGLAGLIKLTSLLSLSAIILIGYLVFSRGTLRNRFQSLFVIALIGGIICGWFYVRNYQLYGDFAGGRAIVEAIYLEDLRKPDNLWSAFTHFITISFGFALFPYLYRNIELYILTLSIWWIVPSIVILRLGFDFIPKNVIKKYTGFKKCYPNRINFLSVLFLAAMTAIFIGALQFMMTIAIDLSERYIMVNSGLGVGYFLYGWNTLLGSGKKQIILYLCFILVLAFVSIFHEVNLISIFNQRLAQ